MCLAPYTQFTSRQVRGSFSSAVLKVKFCGCQSQVVWVKTHTLHLNSLSWTIITCAVTGQLVCQPGGLSTLGLSSCPLPGMFQKVVSDNPTDPDAWLATSGAMLSGSSNYIPRQTPAHCALDKFDCHLSPAPLCQPFIYISSDSKTLHFFQLSQHSIDPLF